jgi:mono/diheme cytochrome c family protein
LEPLRRAAVVALLLVAAACGGGGDKKADNAAHAQEGSATFAANCATCHGPNGTGGTAPTLNAKEMLSAASDEQLTNIISVGIAGTQMRSWSNELGGPLDDDQIANVVAYLRSLEATAPSVPNWRQPKSPSS